MRIDPRTIHLVRISFARLVLDLDQFSHVFYERLFETDPRIEHMFRGARAEQQARLGSMIRTVVEGLDQGQETEALLRGLGWRHVEYGVRRADYAAFGSALMWTLERCLGEAFDAETRNAWETFYLWMTETMQGR